VPLPIFQEDFVSRLQATLLALAAFAALAFPMAVVAQEAEEEPVVLRLSFFMCDLGGGNGDAIEEEMKTRDMPIWNAIVDEGKVQQYGYFFHWWADEWNVGIYTLAGSIQAIIDATEEAGDRLEAQYGDTPTAFSRACPHHRDGFYTMGPNTGMDEAAGGN
jgi:hypothetical protein